MMSLRQLKLLTITLPTLLIGGFEYARHDLFEHYLSMDTGNLYITLLTLLLAYLFASWVFRRFELINARLAEEQAKRAVYEERERLARELHDNIAQTLFFAGVMLNQGKLEEARSTVSDIDIQVRQAIFNLRMPPDRSAGFGARLAGWLHDWSALCGIELKTEVEIDGGAFSPSEELQLFAIVQEAFTNIRKHSRASSASLTLRADQAGWRLAVTDDGVGIGASDFRSVGAAGGGNAAKPGSYGLALMYNRALEMGATFELCSLDEDGHGTRLTLVCRGRTV